MNGPEIAVYDVTTEVECLGRFPETPQSLHDSFIMVEGERAKGLKMWTVYYSNKANIPKGGMTA